MRLKKGFTLAEILIVLMVIGVISTMTIPSLMRGVTETQYKTAFKKAYNAVVNITAIERITGGLPGSATSVGAYRLFAGLNANLSVKEYAEGGFNNGNIYAADAYTSGVKLTTPSEQVFGIASDTALEAKEVSTTQSTPWIVAEDNMAYSIILPNGTSGAACKDKLTINSQTDLATTESSSCAVVIVDVNGLSKGPNILEPQVAPTAEADKLNTNKIMKALTGDQFYIYIGNDGVAAGPKQFTVSGRLASDMP